MSDTELFLPTGEAHVWYARTDRGLRLEWLAACMGLLSVHEKARFDQLRLERSRHEFLIARILCRRTLSRYAGVGLEAWRFDRTQYGQPVVDSPRSARALRFSLSKADGLVVCAVTWKIAVGVDVEALNRSDVPVASASRWFAAREVEDLALCRPEGRTGRFLEYWTLKEAYVKARGMGLSLPFDRFAFSIDNARGIDVCFAPGFAQSGQWRFELLRPTERHVMALAMERQAGQQMKIMLREDSAILETLTPSGRLAIRTDLHRASRKPRPKEGLGTLRS